MEDETMEAVAMLSEALQLGVSKDHISQAQANECLLAYLLHLWGDNDSAWYPF